MVLYSIRGVWLAWLPDADAETGAHLIIASRALGWVGAIWLVGLSGMAIVVFDVPPSTACTTSSVMIAIVGFAVRHMIADLFYGIALALERPFEIGDWIQIPDGSRGQGRVEIRFGIRRSVR